MRRQQYRASQTAVRTASDPQSLLHNYDAVLNPSRPAKSSPLGNSTIAGLPLELLERLKAFPLFQTAPESFLLSIGRSLRPNVYQTSAEIIREGEEAKAMYWLVRGSVRVTSRDGESTYAELKPGAFFGEIGILMDMPRTASIVASMRSLVVRLNKEDLQKELPRYPDVERAIREEALERLTILERKKSERPVSSGEGCGVVRSIAAPRKRSRDWMAGDVEMGEAGSLMDDAVLANKRRKSPSPGVVEVVASNTMHDVPLTVRSLLKELPLFAGLPNDILHYLGVNAQPMSFAPFTDIIKQGSTGRDVYFLIKGDVEILTEGPDSRRTSAQTGPDGKALDDGAIAPRQRVRARLKAGQYFGEVTSLSLAPRRTATVRSVDSVECLLINGSTLDELWARCTPGLRQQVEHEAKRRLSAAKRDDDVVMSDASFEGGPFGGYAVKQDDARHEELNAWRKSLPTVTFEEPPLDDLPTPIQQMEPVDPDPFFNRDKLDNMRAKSRRSSLAPPVPQSEMQHDSFNDAQRTPSPPAHLRILSSSPLKPGTKFSPFASPTSPARLSPTTTRRPSLDRRPSSFGKGRLPDSLLVLIFQQLDLVELMRFRLVSMHWWDLLNTSPDILHHLNLANYNRHVTDDVLRNIIIPFVGKRPRHIDMSNCFHITDEGFKALAEACGESVKMWRMKSVWDVSGPAVLALVDKAKGLEEIDLSNCRKVGDNLLARVVGWIVPDKPAQAQPAPPPVTNGKRLPGKRGATQPAQPEQPPPAPGTVIGASKLKKLTLSYCKHIQDRSMAHIAVHAAERLESLDLTRCTSISDAGFHSWSVYEFKNLRRLVLADCTYLSDQAIIGVVGGCHGLRELDLSFCCALSDTATEVLALGLPALRSLNMAFCGSAVSDNSLRCIGRHLLELRYLSVRGCVRVTGQGVESVVEDCRALEVFDCSVGYVAFNCALCVRKGALGAAPAIATSIATLMFVLRER
ncbi:hypothetical protein LTR78_003488 [Recurvomyces mirabilis]|uniref:RNI-like protein n=1 Tax=Recurvomyces mirabilis TaxID=574656 RepID=A0AAE1C3F0_9PEZI|nr:hypothetical protein LTR78_003488 [Recurvomyces mirabilis]KAK5154478.1 hypothetical protein LTS14_006614 [Recurvomyces mirabilis]